MTDKSSVKVDSFAALPDRTCPRNPAAQITFNFRWKCSGEKSQCHAVVLNSQIPNPVTSVSPVNYF